MSWRFSYFDSVTDDFAALARRLDEELSERNGPWQAEYNVYNHLDGIHDVVLAFWDDKPVGCAAMKRHEAGVYEVKRVFVAPEHRRGGVAKRLMERLEAEARGQGVGRLVLETADTLASAIALYEGLGYQAIPNYGQYQGKPHSRCFSKGLWEKELDLRRVDESEFELLIKTRLDFCREDAPGMTSEELAALEEQTRSWMREHLGAGTYLGYVGMMDGEPVCCAGLLLYSLPPFVGQPNRLQGHVLNFYTYPRFRRQGVGTRLLRFLNDDAKARGVVRLVLNATAAGEPLYLKNGFVDPLGRNLVLKLR